MTDSDEACSQVQASPNNQVVAASQLPQDANLLKALRSTCCFVSAFALLSSSTTTPHTTPHTTRHMLLQAMRRCAMAWPRPPSPLAPGAQQWWRRTGYSQAAAPLPLQDSADVYVASAYWLQRICLCCTAGRQPTGCSCQQRAWLGCCCGCDCRSCVCTKVSMADAL